MKNPSMICLTAIASFGLGIVGCAPPVTVNYVDVDRYLGSWYEIAKYPNSFQGNCYGDTTATYEPHPDFPGDILVLNRCREGSPGGDFQEIVGRATIADAETNAKLRVFFGPVGAPYWIIELDETEGEGPYAWAVVSEPTRRFLWILSRTPFLEEGTLNMILDRIIEQGYEVEKLDWTPQS